MRGAQSSSALAERADARQNDLFCCTNRRRVVRHDGLRADGGKCLLDAAQVADSVIDDSNHKQLSVVSCQLLVPERSYQSIEETSHLSQQLEQSIGLILVQVT